MPEYFRCYSDESFFQDAKSLYNSGWCSNTHIYKCVSLWPVETKPWTEKYIVSEHERLSVNTKAQSRWLKESGNCYEVVLSHTLENYTRHDKSLQLLWKTSKKNVTKTPTRKSVSFVSLTGVNEQGSFFSKRASKGNLIIFNLLIYFIYLYFLCWVT